MRTPLVLLLLLAAARPAAADEDPWLDPTLTTTALGRLNGGEVTAVEKTQLALSGYRKVELALVWTPARGQPVRTVVLEGYCMDWTVVRRPDAVRVIEQCERFSDAAIAVDRVPRGRGWAVNGRRRYSPYADRAARVIRMLANGRVLQATAAHEALGDSSMGHDDLTAWWDELFRRAGDRGLLVDAPRLLARSGRGELARYLRGALSRR